ncbi:hypothetical protein Ddye_007082 [Dipteronia dyeriana]|uniref:Uncharacterized protein n=1 Tax=Dipteronia dyeriana TaxID=168575 RepID=A0AAE0CRB2_9ROSI|nr:hypothetical protein Ddye_007082 [Dipteronia dyeriana]
MGSLMAGWDSPTSDPKSVKYKRNKSLTQEEIDNYWREKKRRDQEEHLKPISSSSDISHGDDDQESKYKEEEGESGVTEKVSLMENDKEAKNLERFMKTNAWWTRSNMAFLNEPPVLEGNTKRYASQFHVANLSTSL